MSFTVLYSDDEDTKNSIINNIFSEDTVIFSRNYLSIKSNYERALFHLKNDIFYDFFKYRKQLNNFTKFKILSTLDKIQEVEEEDVSNKVTVLFDSSIVSRGKRLEVEECTVKDLKRFIFDKIGLSVSKQEILRNEDILNNSVHLSNETVLVRQKRRTNRKK
jgi:hypothetical protein